MYVGNHRIQSDTDEMNKITVDEKQHGQHHTARPTVAVISMIVGVVGLVVGWLVFGLPSAVALVLGYRGMMVTRKGDPGRGMAVVGFTTGALGVILGVMVAIAVLL